MKLNWIKKNLKIKMKNFLNNKINKKMNNYKIRAKN